MVGILTGRGAVVLAHLVVGAEENGLGFGWEERATDWPAVAATT